ncbi:MAG TPA: heme lyase CcmF/NrfE family subunit [Rhizomicrobium sp.]|nr:heme lyase CcmF/NrfE family subunit [Rhizomicrobium sp.]
MTGEIGQLALSLALALSAVMAGAGLAGAEPGAVRARAIANGATMGFLVFVALAFGVLTYAYIVSDFSIVVVAQNSHTLKPLIYKITGVWGNHEGSMLLWVLVLAIYAAAMAAAGRGGARLTSAALGVQGLLAFAFVLFILFTSNPFLRLDPPPFEGNGFNPLLQDPGLAMHPPMLYAGYVGLSATFAYAAAGLITNQADAGWARAARPFMLAAWIALTAGITLGSWWAYYDLGWGGFWFWDPVENAALMPWLVATALLHSALATERTGAFRVWTLLLSIAAFSFSLIGTFLVRSGVLSSVHSFANDPTRGAYILVMIGIAITGALALFAWRAPALEGGAKFEFVSRETTLLINNVLLVYAVAVVFVGTLYPLFLDAVSGTKISVGAPYFARLFAPAAVALILIVPFGPRLPWQEGSLKAAARALLPALGGALLAGALVLAFAAPRSLVVAGSFALGVWTVGASAVDFVHRRRARALSAAALASMLAHAGLGVTLFGIAGVTAWRVEALDVLAPGQELALGPYMLRFDGVRLANGPNFQAERATVTALRGGKAVTTLYPEQRFYPVERQAISDTAIRTTGYSDLYVALGDDRGGGRFVLRAYYNPLAPFIWFGGAIMALGGFASLWSRVRFRAPRRVGEMAPAE